MGKKQTGGSRPRPQKSSHRFNIESSRYLVPLSFLFLFLALVFLFSDFVFSDKMLHGSDVLQAGYFYRSFLVDYFKEHLAVPSWNPYIFGGMPYIEAFHGDIFYPLSAIKLIGSLDRMLGWNLFWHILLAGLFMYFCGRQFRLSKTAALVAAASYMFSGYLISLVAPGHDGKIFVTALFPLAMLFLNRGFEKRPILNFSLLGLSIGLMILTPHPQMSYFSLWALCLYMMYRLVFLYRERRSIGPLISKASFTAGAVVIGLMLSAIQFFPGYTYTNQFSPRADTKRGWEWATSWSMHEEEAFSLVIPEFSGSVSQKTSTYYWGKNAFKDNSESVGVVSLFLALLGSFFGRRKERWFFGGLAVFVLTYALGATTPLFHLYYLIPKVASMRAASMIMFLFAFSIAMLAGMGVQRITELVKDGQAFSPRFRYLLWGAPGLMLALALLFSSSGRGMINLWTSLFYSEASKIMVQQGVSKLDLAYLNLPSITTGAWWGFLFVLAAAAALWLVSSRRAGIWLLLALAAIVVTDGVRFSSRFVSVLDSQEQFRPDALVQFLKERDGKFRVLDVRSRQSPKTNDLHFHHLEGVAGYHGNQLRWYDDLLGSMQLRNLFQARFLNLMGVRYIVVPSGQRFPGDYFGSKPVIPLATFGRFQVLENQNAFPRVYVCDNYEVVSDRSEIYPRVIGGPEDLRRLVYLEEPPEMAIVQDTASGDSAWVIGYEIDSVTVGVSLSSNKLLVLTDSWYDAWKVTVDGRPAVCQRSYGALRAVAVPAGAEKVVFRFESSRYRMGKTITLATALFLVVVLGGNVMLGRRRTDESEGEAA